MKSKFLLIIVVCILTTLLLNIAASATEAEDITFDGDIIEPIVYEPFDFSKPIKVGYYSGYTDFADDIDSLSNKGYGVEIFNKIEEVSDLQFQYIPVDNDLMAALFDGDIDLLAFNTKNESREERVLYSKNPFGKTYIALLSEDMDIVYGDFEALDGKTVASYEGNIGNERLDFFMENLDFSLNYIYGEPHNYYEIDADLRLGFSEDREVESLNNVLDIGVYNLYLNSTFENQELMDVIDSIFYDIAVTEGNFFLELEEKYMAQNVEITHRGLMPDEIEVLQQQTLEVGYIADFRPICYMDELGEPGGAMVDTLNYFADRYDFDVNYHPYSLNDPPEDHEEYDLLVTLYSKGEDEWEHYTATEPYYIIPLYAQVHSDIYFEVDNKWNILETPTKIGSLPYLTVEFDNLLDYYPLTEFIYYDDWHTLLDAFAAREIDMLFSTESAKTYAELYLEDVDRISLRTDTEVPMQYFINNDIAGEYIPVFNVMLDRLPESEYELIIQTNSDDFLPDQDVSLWAFIAKYWYVFIILLLIVLMSFGIYKGLKTQEKQKALEVAYTTDYLTGLMNLTKFSLMVEDLLKKINPDEYEVISFDVDMFKTINTHFSPDRGTEVILAISESLKKAFQNTSVLYTRRTADQFLIFRRINDGGSINHIYNTFILPEIEQHLNRKYKISLSFGNMIINDTKQKVSSIVGGADTARRHGKSSHKTTFVTFDEEMQKQYENKINVTFRMEQALKDNEFYIEIQPKISFDTLQIGGAEALVRWSPKLGDKLYPDSFIPIFEENGFISDIDMFVLEETCRFIISNFLKMDIPHISVNLSAHTVLSDNILNRIADIVNKFEINPEFIELELTESAVEADTEMFLLRVAQFKKMGFSISIDDFGAGVSSLNRLSSIDADVLKLDKAFFGYNEQGKKNSVVVADVISMAKHLNMKVVAEGVETTSQAAWLKKIGCDYAQGYYFEKPMSVEAFKTVLTDKKQYTIEN